MSDPELAWEVVVVKPRPNRGLLSGLHYAYSAWRWQLVYRVFPWYKVPVLLVLQFRSGYR